MIAVEKYRIAYFSIPKVACSSIKRMVMTLDPPRYSHVDQNHVHKAYPSSPFHKCDLESISDYWKFAVVRDPVRRLLSCYSSKVVTGRVLHRLDPEQLRTDSGDMLSPDPDPDTFFERLREYRHASPIIRRHSARYRRYIGEDLSFFDAIFPIEDLPDMVAALTDRTGQDVTLRHDNRSPSRIPFDDLSSQAKRRIGRYCREDYALLNAYYSPPETPKNERDGCA